MLEVAGAGVLEAEGMLVVAEFEESKGSGLACVCMRSRENSCSVRRGESTKVREEGSHFIHERRQSTFDLFLPL